MKISVQLYTLRDVMSHDPAGTLAALRQMGYRYVETAGTAGKSPAEFRAMLDASGLQVSGMHVGIEACEADIDAVLAEAEALDAPYVIVPYAPESSYQDGWDKLAVRLQAIGEKVTAAGRTFAYHNHAFEFAPVDGRTGWDLLLDAASPEHVKAQIDLWWVFCGGHSPADTLMRYAGRTPLVHLKDGTECADHAQIEAGRGVMKWDEVLKACDDAQVEFGVVELDTCPNPPLESVKVCLDFFRSKGHTE